MRRFGRRRRRRNSGRGVGFWSLGAVGLLLTFGVVVFGADSLRPPQEVDPVERVASPAVAQGEAPRKEKGTKGSPAAKDAEERVAEKAAEEGAERAAAEQAVAVEDAAEEAK